VATSHQGERGRRRWGVRAAVAPGRDPGRLGGVGRTPKSPRGWHRPAVDEGFAPWPGGRPLRPRIRPRCLEERRSSLPWDVETPLSPIGRGGRLPLAGAPTALALGQRAERGRDAEAAGALGAPRRKKTSGEGGGEGGGGLSRRGGRRPVPAGAAGPAGAAAGARAGARAVGGAVSAGPGANRGVRGRAASPQARKGQGREARRRG